MTDFLDKIVQSKLADIELLYSKYSFDELDKLARENCNRGFGSAIKSSSKNIIAEFKRSSPSKGIINNEITPAIQAKDYEKCGAKAISVLTEEHFFKGHLNDLIAVRNVTNLPVLRKDFILDKLQIAESATTGCDAILLIVSLLTKTQIDEFLALAKEYHLAVVVEVFDQKELDIAIDAQAEIIAVNNRNLRTFEVDKNNIIKFAPQIINSGATPIAASGILDPHDMQPIQQLGVSTFLIGEALMRATPERRREFFYE